jgi:hypothetical protein
MMTRKELLDKLNKVHMEALAEALGMPTDDEGALLLASERLSESPEGELLLATNEAEVATVRWVCAQLEVE